MTSVPHEVVPAKAIHRLEGGEAVPSSSNETFSCSKNTVMYSTIGMIVLVGSIAGITVAATAGSGAQGGYVVLPTSDSTYIGCYVAPENSAVQRVERRDRDCAAACVTEYFAVSPNTPDTCLCIPDVGPALFDTKGNTTRLSFDQCSFVARSNIVEVYFRLLQAETDCTNDDARALRDILTSAGNSPKGLDVFTGEKKPTIFQLHKDGCNTNMWNIIGDRQGQSSQVEMETFKAEKVVTEKRFEFFQSIKTEGSVGIPLIAQFKSSLSASIDMKSRMKESRRSLSESKFIEANAKRTIARIEIPASRKHFVTLQGTGSSGFLGRLVDYNISGYSESEGMKILKQFGQIVLTEAAFGGYYQSIAEYNREIEETLRVDEREIKACYAAKADGSGVFKGIRLGGSAETESCTETGENKLEHHLASLVNKVKNTKFVGGDIVDDEFVVTPEHSVLLIKPELYDAGEKPKMVWLPDILQGDLISPHTCKQSGLSEDDFQRIHVKLRGLLKKLLENVDKTIDECGCEGVSFLDDFTYEDGKISSNCECIGNITLPGKLREDTMRKILQQRVNLSFGWRDHCATCNAVPSKFAVVQADGNCLTEGHDTFCKSNYGVVNSDGGVDGNDRFYVGIGANLAGGSVSGTLEQQAIDDLRYLCVALGWRDRCVDCRIEPEKQCEICVDKDLYTKSVGSHTKRIGDYCTLKTDGSVNGDDVFYMRAFIHESAPSSSPILKFARDKFNLDFGWRDRCDGCKVGPERYGSTRFGDQCASAHAARCIGGFIGFNTAGNVDGNDNWYIRLSVRN